MAETVKGLNIKIGLDSSDLDAKLKDLKGDLKEQQNDLKSINNSLKYDSSNVDLWKKKQTNLNQTLETTKQRLDVQNKRLDEARKAVQIGAMSETEFNKLRRSVEYTEADINKLNNELDKTKGKITALGNVKWDNLAKVGSTLTKSLTVPILGAVTALTTLSVKSMQTADEIADNASKVHLSVEAFQEWSHAAQILAVDSTKLQLAFIKTNALLGDIATGNVTTKISDAFAQIGLSMEDFIGLDTDGAFSLLRNKLSEVKDETLRTAVANEIFGDKVGAELAQILGASANQISDLRDEAKKLGIVTDEQAEIAGEFTDSLDNMKMSLQSVGYELGAIVVPALTKVANKIIDDVVPAIKNLINWWTNLSSGVKKVIGIFTGVLVSIGPILTVVGKLVPLIKSLAGAFTAVKGSVMIAGSAIKLSTLGWGALIAVIAVILLQNERFRELLKKIIDVVKDILAVVMKLVEKLVAALMPIIEKLMGVINFLIEIVVNLLDEILDPIIEILDVVIGLIEDLIPVVEEIITMLASLLVPIIEVIKQLLVPIMDIIRVIIDLIVKVVSALTTLIKSVLGTLMKIIEALADILRVVIDIVIIAVNLVSRILTPVLEILMAILDPIFKILEVIITVIEILMEVLGPLIDMFLQPLLGQLNMIARIIEFFAPLLELVANIIEAVVCPVLEMLMFFLKPIMDILNAIIDAFKWVADNIGGIFDGIKDVVGGVGDFFKGAWDGVKDFFGGIGKGVSDFFGGIGNWFSDTFNIGKKRSASSNQTTNNSTTNNVTVNTSSSKFDVDSINVALGGSYL